MAKITVLFSVALILLGVVGYLGTPVDSGTLKENQKANDNQSSELGEQSSESADNTSAKKSAEEKPKKRSFTALIPSAVGVVMLSFGLLAFKEPWRKFAMHVAATIGLLGFLAGTSRVVSGLSKAFGDNPPNWRSFGYVTAMTLICAVFVALCVNSFMQARRERKELEAMAQRDAS